MKDRVVVRRACSAREERLLDLARTSLAAAGFRVGPARDGALEAEGPGLRSSRQNPRVSASRLTVRVEPGRLEVDAELGGLRVLRRFLWIFPLGLGLALSALFLLLHAFGGMPRAAALAPLFAVSPWVVLAPLMSAWLRRRAVAAVERLADSLAAA